jgi:hypothetical protein
MDYDSFVASPALAVERQRAWVAFMAAQVVACDDAASFHDVLGAVDLMLAEWDKRFAPPVNLVAVTGSDVKPDICSLCGCAECSHRG